jgi:hypothetical protein
VLAIQPAGYNGGNEELRAVAIGEVMLVKELLGHHGKVGYAYVLGPALAIERSPGLEWVFLKFSSANFSP